MPPSGRPADAVWVERGGWVTVGPLAATAVPAGRRPLGRWVVLIWETGLRAPALADVPGWFEARWTCAAGRRLGAAAEAGDNAPMRLRSLR